jgi:hypothetical protein
VQILATAPVSCFMSRQSSGGKAACQDRRTGVLGHPLRGNRIFQLHRSPGLAALLGTSTMLVVLFGW